MITEYITEAFLTSGWEAVAAAMLTGAIGGCSFVANRLRKWKVGAQVDTEDLIKVGNLVYRHNNQQKPFSGVAVEKFSNGKIYKSTVYRNGVPWGPYNSYDFKGCSMEEGKYKNGKLHGFWRQYHSKKDPSGFVVRSKFFTRGFYKDGMKVGLWRSWYPDGGSESKEEYDKDGTGKKVLWAIWNTDGKLKESKSLDPETSKTKSLTLADFFSLWEDRKGEYINFKVN